MRSFSGQHPAPADPPTPEEVAAAVRVPTRMRAALEAWRELHRRHDALTGELRQLIAAPPAAGREHRRDAEILRIDREIGRLGGEVRAALIEVAEARRPHAAAVAEVLSPLLRDAAADALTAAERMAAAFDRLDQIDRELARHGARPLNLRSLRPGFGPLRRRLMGLA